MNFLTKNRFVTGFLVVVAFCLVSLKADGQSLNVCRGESSSVTAAPWCSNANVTGASWVGTSRGSISYSGNQITVSNTNANGNFQISYTYTCSGPSQSGTINVTIEGGNAPYSSAVVQTVKCDRVTLGWAGVNNQQTYWQTVDWGESTNHNVHMDVFENGTYFIRRLNPDECWSPALAVNVTQYPGDFSAGSLTDTGTLYDQCPGYDPPVIRANAATRGTEYKWYANNSPISNSNVEDYNPGPLYQTTTFNRRVKDPCGNWVQSGNYRTIEINTISPGSIGVSSVSACNTSNGRTITNTSSASAGPDGVSYSWSISPSLSSSHYQNNGSSLEIKNSAPPNTYTVRRKATNTANSCAQAWSNSVTFTKTAPFSAGSISPSNASPLMGCGSANPGFINGSAAVGHNAYRWKLGNSVISGATGEDFDPPSTSSGGTYKREVRRACDGAWIASSGFLTVDLSRTVNPGSISVASGSVCAYEGNSINNVSSATGGSQSVTYSWITTISSSYTDNGRGNVSSFNTLSNLPAGTYSVSRKAENSTCSATTSSISFTKKAPVSTGTVTATHTDCGEMTLTHSGSGAVHWETTTNNFNQTGNKPVTSTGTYRYKVLHNGCWSDVASFTLNNIPSGPLPGTLKGDGVQQGIASGALILTGIDGTLQGYEYSDNGGSWQFISTNDATYNYMITNTSGSTINRRYKAKVSKNLCEAYSNIVTVTINPVSQTPSDVCEDFQTSINCPSPSAAGGYDFDRTYIEVIENGQITRVKNYTLNSCYTEDHTFTRPGLAVIRQVWVGRDPFNNYEEVYLYPNTNFYQVNPKPDAPSTIVNKLVQCGGTPLQFNAADVPPSETWHWQVEGEIRVQNAVNPYPVTMPGNYYIQSQTDKGCWSDGRQTVTVVEADIRLYPDDPVVIRPVKCSNGSAGITLGTTNSTDRWFSDASTTTPLSGYNYVTVPNGSEGNTYYVESRSEDDCTVRLPYVVADVEITNCLPNTVTESRSFTVNGSAPCSIPSQESYDWDIQPAGTGSSVTNTLNLNLSNAAFVRVSNTYTFECNDGGTFIEEGTMPLLDEVVMVRYAPSAPPLNVAQPSINYECDQATVTFSGTPNDLENTWYWVDYPEHESFDNPTSITVNSPGGVYLRNYNVWSGWGAASLVTVSSSEWIDSELDIAWGADIEYEECTGFVQYSELIVTNNYCVDVSNYQLEWTTVGGSWEPLNISPTVEPNGLKYLVPRQELNATYRMALKSGADDWPIYSNFENLDGITLPALNLTVQESAGVCAAPLVSELVVSTNSCGLSSYDLQILDASNEWVSTGLLPEDVGGNWQFAVEKDEIDRSYRLSSPYHGHSLSNKVIVVALPAATLETYYKSSRNKPYVKTYAPREPMEECVQFREDPNQVIEQIAYIDGLGRTIQELTRNGTPLDGLGVGKDVVSLMSYDNVGRQNRTYLPYPEADNAGTYRASAEANQVAYQNTRFGANNSTYGHSRPVYEASGLNRVKKQVAPGYAWREPAGRTVENVYTVNSGSEGLLQLEVQSGYNNIIYDLTTGYYGAGELTKEITMDENATNRGEVITYTDPKGLVVAKQVKLSASAYGTTYYVYDDFDQLRYVIQPEAVRLILDDPAYNWAFVNDATFQENWMFAYQYDARKRMIAKRVPGADWVYMVYDQWDRLVMTQDGNQRKTRTIDTNTDISHYSGESYQINGAVLTLKNGFHFSASKTNKFVASATGSAGSDEWTYTKYDYLNRPVMTGIVQNSSDRQTLQGLVDAFYAGGALRSESYTGTGSLEGYTDQTYPNGVNASTLLTVSYYDNYGFTSEVAPVNALSKVVGAMTGSKTRVIGSDQWLTNVTFYDNRMRAIKSVADNHLGGQDVVTTTYRNTVSPLVNNTVRTHSDGTNTTTIEENYVYDHLDRLRYVNQKIDGAPSWTEIARNTYNDVGELTQKRLGGGAQNVNYAYNIRGWLTQINGGNAAADPADKFGLHLLYDDASTNPQYNGNIGEVRWVNKGGSTTTEQKYNFSYDESSRLTNAAYTGSGNKTVSGLHYDHNGNIQRLVRANMDDLTYGYSANRLRTVDDAITGGSGFVDGASTMEEYFYDKNGNMIRDMNKGIDHINYNYLNLPELVVLDNGTRINYNYDAAGVKLNKVVEGGKDIHYIGGIHYEQETGESSPQLEFLQHAEGRALKSGGTYNYEYNLTDHLGNVRVTVDGSGNVQQAQDYYPFGSVFNESIGSPENLYKYGGKEEQKEWDVYDFGARMYDPALGRFGAIDPLADLYVNLTPYNYVANNPLLLIDPDGMEIVNGAEKKREKAQARYDQKKKDVDAAESKYGTKKKDFGSKADYKKYKTDKRAMNQAKRDVKTYTRDSEATQNLIDDLKENSPNMFNELDNLKNEFGQTVDVYISSTSNVRGPNDGATIHGFSQDSQGNIFPHTTSYGRNTIEVEISNSPSGGRSTLTVTKHEMGHTSYQGSNTGSYYKYLKKNGKLGQSYDGHAPDDPSGKRALKYQNLADIEK